MGLVRVFVFLEIAGSGGRGWLLPSVVCVLLVVLLLRSIVVVVPCCCYCSVRLCCCLGMVLLWSLAAAIILLGRVLLEVAPGVRASIFLVQGLAVFKGHMDVEWCNRTHVMRYLFEYVTKGSDRIGSESTLKSPRRAGSKQGHMNVEWCNRTQVVRYLFEYVTKGSDQVGSGSVLESSPRARPEQLHSSIVDDPNPPPAPSTMTRLSSHKDQANAQL